MVTDDAELSAAHGYLLAQFSSAKTNLRTDAYGGTAKKRAKIIVDVVKAMREATPKGFTIGIKFNSVDHQSESELKDCIEQLREIVDAGIDFLEVSGGSYEDPQVSCPLQLRHLLNAQKCGLLIILQPSISSQESMHGTYLTKFSNQTRPVC